MQKLNKEQAVILTAVTGVACMPIRDYTRAVSERLGRTIRMENLTPEVSKELRDLYYSDFIKLTYDGS